MKRITLEVTGMTCGHCEQAVARALQQVEGIERVAVSHAKGRATVDAASTADSQRLVQAVQEEGYEAKVI